MGMEVSPPGSLYFFLISYYAFYINFNWGEIKHKAKKKTQQKQNCEST